MIHRCDLLKLVYEAWLCIFNEGSTIFINLTDDFLLVPVYLKALSTPRANDFVFDLPRTQYFMLIHRVVSIIEIINSVISHPFHRV
jgi:hypothetical protein